MQVPAKLSPDNRLPLTGDLKAAYHLSLAVAIGTAVISIASLVFQTIIYPTEDIRQSFLANDVINLIIGIPILIGCMWLARQHNLIGLLCWPGALIYGLYNYIAYAVGVPLSLMSIVYFIIVLLSAYAILDLLKNIDKHSLQTLLDGAVPVKITGGILIAFGILFILRALGMIVGNQMDLLLTEWGVLLADIVLSILCIVGGVLLLQQRPLGYVSGLGLLFAACMLFVGLVLFLLLQPVLTGAPFVLTDVIVVAVMGLIFFVPFGLFVRGLQSKT